MSDFEKALKFTLRMEGGYSDDPADHGGKTNCGITQSTYNEYLKSHGFPIQSVSEITMREVNDIYFNQYWIPAKCDKMEWPLNLVQFDTAVNGGIMRANRFLQMALQVKPDGIIGPITLSVLDAVNQQLLAGIYITLREQWYKDIVLADPTQAVFVNGWQNRINALRKAMITS